MSRGWMYKSGSWNIVCDRCSTQVKANKIRQEWTGLLVCQSCYEPRHEQEFLKIRQDRISVPFSRPEPTEVFVGVPYINVDRYVDYGYTLSGYFEETTI